MGKPKLEMDVVIKVINCAFSIVNSSPFTTNLSLSFEIHWGKYLHKLRLEGSLSMRVRFLLIPVVLALMTGCIGNGNIYENLEENPNVRIVRDIAEGGPGPLTKENVAIGGIRIGDTRDTVRKILGEPATIQEGGGGTPFVHWFYEQHNAYIFFYRASETDPVGGVAEIAVNLNFESAIL